MINLHYERGGNNKTIFLKEEITSQPVIFQLNMSLMLALVNSYLKYLFTLIMVQFTPITPLVFIYLPTDNINNYSYLTFFLISKQAF